MLYINQGKWFSCKQIKFNLKKKLLYDLNTVLASQILQKYCGLQNNCHLFGQTFSLEVTYFLHNFVTYTFNLCFPFSIRHQVSCLRTTGKIMVP